MRYGKVSSKGERAALGGQGETGVGTYSPVRLCPAHERSESCVIARRLGSWPVPRGGRNRPLFLDGQTNDVAHGTRGPAQ